MSDLRKRAEELAQGHRYSGAQTYEQVAARYRQAMAEALDAAAEQLEAAGVTTYDVRQMAADLRKDEGR